jgi:hypothetical protein
LYTLERFEAYAYMADFSKKGYVDFSIYTGKSTRTKSTNLGGKPTN